MTLRIKGVETLAELRTYIGKYIGGKIIDQDNIYKGDTYYKPKAYTIYGYFGNKGKWYIAGLIYKGILKDVKDAKTNNWTQD